MRGWWGDAARCRPKPRSVSGTGPGTAAQARWHLPEERCELCPFSHYGPVKHHWTEAKRSAALIERVARAGGVLNPHRSGAGWAHPAASGTGVFSRDERWGVEMPGAGAGPVERNRLLGVMAAFPHPAAPPQRCHQVDD